MGAELRRLKQELNDTVKAIGIAQKTADNAQAEVAAKVAAVLHLQEQYDLLESSFNERIDQEIVSIVSVDVNELDLAALGNDGAFSMEWLMEENPVNSGS